MVKISSRKTYRFLRVGEVIQKGDLYGIDGNWGKTLDVGEKVQCGYSGRYIREVKRG